MGRRALGTGAGRVYRPKVVDRVVRHVDLLRRGPEVCQGLTTTVRGDQGTSCRRTVHDCCTDCGGGGGSSRALQAPR